MYCKKCGKKANAGDTFCAGCGKALDVSRENASAPAPEKKKGGFNGWIFLLLCVAILVPKWMGLQDTAPAESAKVEIAAENNAIYSGRGSCTAEPDLAGLREEKGDSPEGTLLRYYRQDNTLAVEKLVYAEDSARVTHYDPFENPLAVFEYDGGMGVYLEYYYDNIYDGQGRLCYQSQCNSRGAVALENIYTYASDGSFTREVTEYRGAWVYSWDYEAHGEDNPVVIYHAVISCDAGGQELSREESILD